MKTAFFKFVIPIAAIILLLLMIGWMAGLFKQKISPGAISINESQASEAVSVTRREQAVFESVPGSIEAKQATLISSRILSRIEKVHVRAGNMVKKGQLLIELEQTDLQSRVAQTIANIESVNARLIEARQSLSRARELAGKGLLAQADLDKAQANHDRLLADLSNARQALGEANAALSFARVKAPIDGRVVDRFAEPGDTVQPGVKLLSLYNPLSLRVEANVREQLALSLQPGQALQVSIPALGTTVGSEIEEIVPAGNVGSRSFLIKSRLQQSQGLLPGMYAQLHIPSGSKSLLLIPLDCVARVGQLDIVWVLSEGIVARRLVRTGKIYQGDLIEIISGLEEHESVVPVKI